MLNATYSTPSYDTRPRQPVLTLAAALLLVVLLGSVLLAVALREDGSSIPAGGPGGGNDRLVQVDQTATATPFPFVAPPPIMWRTGTAALTADAVTIIANGMTFTSDVTYHNVTSDPGDPGYTTLEMTWQEHDVEMRLNIYFYSDGERWWADEVRTYNGSSEPEWITYRGEYFMTPLDEAFTTEEFTLVSETDASALTFRNLRVEAFLPSEGQPAAVAPADAQAEAVIAVTATPIPFTVQPAGPHPAEPPVSYRLEGVPHEYQTWNNQGPANLSMALRYWGWDGDQQMAGIWLKPNSEDKSVSPWQMAYFVSRFTDYKAIYRLGGTTELLRRLIAAGFPVIIQTGFQPEGEDWLGHYRLIWGYEGSQTFLAHDSYLGPDQTLSASEIESGWREFAHTFIVVYDPAREMDLRLALGAYADPVAAAGQALIARQLGTGGFASDAWGAFSLGTSYVTLGDFESAAEAYDRAFELGLPWRTLWYQFGPFEAYFHTGRYIDLVRLIDNTLAIAQIEEAYYWRGMAYAAQGSPEGAATNFAAALELNPNFFTAQTEYFRLESASFNLPPQMMGVTDEMPRPAEASALPPTVVPPDPLLATPDSTATAIIEIVTATVIPPTAVPATATFTATPIMVVPETSATPGS